MMSIMTIMAFGGIINSDFGLFYQVPMNSGLLNSTTAVLGTYIYRMGMLGGQYGLTAAVGLLNSVVGFILLVISNKLSRKYSEFALF